MPGSVQKAQLRRRVWQRLTRRGVARLPGAFGRTPTFVGQGEAVGRLREQAIWRQARRVLVLAEAVLAEVRGAAIADGKVLVVPDLECGEECWIQEFDPATLAPEVAAALADELGEASAECAAPVCRAGHATPPVDLMVIGAVAVNRRGVRIGKGQGTADLIYALGRDRGFLTSETPVAAFVHGLQVIDDPADREPTDLPVDYIVTPDDVLQVATMVMRPKGLHPSMVTPERLAAFPRLRMILEREGIHPGEANRDSPA